MTEDLYVTNYTDASGNTRSFKCVKSQLLKTKGCCPVSGKLVLDANGSWNYANMS